MEPETEAHPAGVLLCLLTAYGNAIGNRARCQAGPDDHPGNLFTLLVGTTASRKGQAEGIVTRLMEQADPPWASGCILSGLSTGEGLTERLRDESVGDDGFGNLTVKPGVADKRALCIEREFASVFKKSGREGNTLSAVLRCAWDGKPLEVVNRQRNSLKATGHHVSILGHITPKELEQCLSKGTEAVNGFLNRFLLCHVSRARKLPSGGDMTVLDPFVARLSAAIAYGKGEEGSARPPIRRTHAAEQMWAGWYHSRPERDDLTGDVTARAEAQVLRLSLLYALADGGDVIDVPHLRAALAVWDYCERSAEVLFGEETKADTTSSSLSLPDRLLEAIRRRPGIQRQELYGVVGHQTKADEIGPALDYLEQAGQAHSRMQPTGGRPAECWFPGRKEVSPLPSAGGGGASQEDTSFPSGEPAAQRGTEQGRGELFPLGEDDPELTDEQVAALLGRMLDEAPAREADSAY